MSTKGPTRRRGTNQELCATEKEETRTRGGVGSNKVKEYYGNGKEFGVNITYIKQEEPKGIAHAIRLCKDFVNDEKFLVFLGDNIIQKSIKDFVESFKNSDYDSTVL